jgi:type VI protein secretion system component VasK
MQFDPGKVIVSVIMWIVIGVMGTAALGTVNSEEWVILPILAILIFGGAAGMTALWRRMPWESDRESVSREQAEKSKRRGRVERLMDGLNDQEREELLTRLTESDGEVSLEEVLRRR